MRLVLLTVAPCCSICCCNCWAVVYAIVTVFAIDFCGVEGAERYVSDWLQLVWTNSTGIDAGLLSAGNRDVAMLAINLMIGATLYEQFEDWVARNVAHIQQL